MAIKVQRIQREFRYQGLRLPDPDPAMSTDEVRDIYVGQYPELTNATVDGPETSGNKLIYTFDRAVGTKG